MQYLPSHQTQLQWLHRSHDLLFKGCFQVRREEKNVERDNIFKHADDDSDSPLENADAVD